MSNSDAQIRPRRGYRFYTISCAAVLVVSCSSGTNDGAPETKNDAGSSDPSKSKRDSGSQASGGSSSTDDASAAGDTSIEDATESEPVDGISCDVEGSGESPVIDNFEDGDLQVTETDNRVGSWEAFDDSDGDSTSLIIENGAAHLAGVDVPGWGGVALRLHQNDDGVCRYDASAYRGFSFRVKGSGEVRFKVYTPDTIPEDAGGECITNGSEECWGDHGAAISLTEEWTTYELTFGDLQQPEWALPANLDAARLVNFLFQLDGQPDFDLWFDDVSFLMSEDDVSTDAGPRDAGQVDAAATSGDSGSPDAALIGNTSDASASDADARSDAATSVSPDAG